MSRVDHYAAQFVESFPEPMEPGLLYVSLPYSTAGHICPCGCDRQVVTKLSPARYKVIFDGEVSLKPSVAATGLPCNSHYFITRGRVEWHRQLNATEAARAQAADAMAVQARRSPAVKQRARWWKRLRRPTTG